MDVALYKKLQDGIVPIVKRVVTGNAKVVGNVGTIEQISSGWQIPCTADDITIPEVDPSRAILEYAIEGCPSSYQLTTYGAYIKDDTHIRVVTATTGSSPVRFTFIINYRIIEFVRGGYKLLISLMQSLRNEVIA